jgi:hypothetical protein
MTKTASLALGALALTVMSGAAIAQDAGAQNMGNSVGMEDGGSDLQAAAKDVGSSGDDVGFQAFTPPRHKQGASDQIGTIDLKFTPFYRYENAGDLNHDQGEIETSRYGANLRLDYHDEDRNLWSFRYGYEYSDYDVSSAPSQSIAEDALDDATVYSLTFSHMRTIQDKWSAFGGVGYQWGGTDGVGFSSGRNFMGAVGAIHEIDQNLTYGLGLLVREDFDDDAVVLPLPILTWIIDGQSRLRVRGTRVDYEYDVEHDLTAHGIFAWEYRAYRLEDEVENTRAKDGAVNDMHYILGVGLDWKPEDLDWLTVSLETGAIFGQKFEVEDDDGHVFSTARQDDAVGFFIGLSALLSF